MAIALNAHRSKLEAGMEAATMTKTRAAAAGRGEREEEQEQEQAHTHACTAAKIWALDVTYTRVDHAARNTNVKHERRVLRRSRTCRRTRASQDR